METTTNKRRKIIGVAALLLLLASGAGVMYMYNQHPTANNSDTSGQMAMAAENPAAVDAASADIAPTTDATQTGTESAPIAGRPTRYRRHHSGGATASDDDQLVVASRQTYEGNIPSASTETTVEPSTAATEPKTNAVKNSDKKTVTSYAKSSGRSHNVHIAPEVGGNLNGLYHNNSGNVQTDGFHAGIMVNVGLGNSFAIQPGLRYILKGNKDKSVSSSPESADINITHTMKLNYLELPLNLVYKFGDKPGAPRFMIGAGPYASYLLSSKEKFATTTTDDAGFLVNTPNNYGSSNLKKFDYGVGGFIGCQMPGGFYANAGTEWGLRDLTQDPVSGKPSDRNYNILISVGYIIGSKNTVY